MLVRLPNDADQTTSSRGGRSKANEYLPATLVHVEVLGAEGNFTLEN